MSGARSRRKGAVGERELAALFREHGYDCRRGQQFKGSPDSPDVTGHGLPIHAECKRTERLNLYDAIAQAVRDAGDGLMPVVFHRKNNSEWLAVVRAADFFALVREGMEGG
jgi:hypothetical protein